VALVSTVWTAVVLVRRWQRSSGCIQRMHLTERYTQQHRSMGFGALKKKSNSAGEWCGAAVTMAATRALALSALDIGDRRQCE
jgi:hypothetical protein